MKNFQWTIVAVLLLASEVIILTGCDAYQKREQLEAVARDWCYTIRASQVIPVYPLTEDVQPGDVFLVQLPIERQQELYKKKGFLPLDYHIGRLDPAYVDFYGHSFFDRSQPPLLPRDWIRPSGTVKSWDPAPNASFPSYSFSVKRGAGMNVAFPVQGIPIGLSLIGSDAADGSVSISEAHTLGVDIISLYDQLKVWAKDHRDFLAGFAPAKPDIDPTNYLRVVNRVYVTGKVDVSLNDVSSTAAGLDVGAPRPVELLKITPPSDSSPPNTTTLEDYQSSLEKMNTMLERAITGTSAAPGASVAPGGSLRVTAAGARRISLQQTFDKPLVLGYLGFDVPIGYGGLLGYPIPTHTRIDKEFKISNDLSARGKVYMEILKRPAYIALKEKAKTQPNGKAAKIVAALDALADQIPPQPLEYATARGSGLTVIQRVRQITTVGQRTYLDVLVYSGSLDRSVKVLNRALKSDQFTYEDVSGTTTAVDRDNPVRETLAMDRDSLDEARQRLKNDPVHQNAIRAAILAILEE